MGKAMRIGSAVLAMGLALAFGFEGASEAAVVRARGVMTKNAKSKKVLVVNGKRFLLNKKTRLSLDNTKVLDTKLRSGMMVLIKGRSAIGASTVVADAVQGQDEVQGRITAINAAANPPTFTILNQNVFVDDMTIFANIPAPGGVAGLALDQFVEAHGFRDETGAVRASRVEVKAGAGEVEVEKQEVKGEIAALDDVAKTFTIGTQAVNFAGATMSPAGATLANGNSVEVAGDIVGGVLVATRVDREDLEDEAFEPRNGQKTRIEGYVSGLVDGGTTFSIDSTTILLLPNTQFRRGANTDLANGVLVEAEGTQTATGLAAREISFERNRIRVEGTATDLTGGVTMLGLSLEIDALTDQRDVPTVGGRFQARGFKDKAGNLIAEEVRASGDPRDHLQGPVDAISAGSVTILGKVVDLSGAVFQNDLDQPMTAGQFFGTVKPGTLVKVRLNGGTLVADEAEIEK